MINNLPTAWAATLRNSIPKADLETLQTKLQQEYQTKTIYPPKDKLYTSLLLCPPEQVRVVILGQDPYHGPGQANGLAFSVVDEVPHPPSLQNIYKEIHADTGVQSQTNGDLTAWAKQGVLLLNTTLTVQAGQPGSHRALGWEPVTQAIISHLATTQTHLVYLLWGQHAQNAATTVPQATNCVLTAPHPSPLSAYRGFLGCKHFSQANAYLEQHGKKPIIW